MTDFATVDAPQVSTTLEMDTGASPSGGGTPRIPAPEEPKEPVKEAPKPSLRDIVAEEAKTDPKEDAPADAAKPDKDADEAKGKAQEEKGAEKPEGEEKPAPKKDEAAEEKPAAKGKPEADSDKRHIEPPKRFNPDAKELWRNVPHAVRRDMDAAFREHEQEVTRYREAAERYEPIRQFDELARQGGRAGAHESLQEVAQLEEMMQRSPLAALNQILLRAGPRKPDGQPVSLYEVAEFVVSQGRDGYQKMVTAQPQQQQGQQADPEVQQLKAELAQIKEQQIEGSIIAPFRTSHPRYDELKDDIAFFLKSGKVPANLSPADRLEVAYDMAVRINPASHDEPATTASDGPGPGSRAGNQDFSGSKSIKSAPGAVSANMEPERGGPIRDLISAEMKRAVRSK